MKATIIKWLLGISALLFADWVIMIIPGCFSVLCHANNNFYCSVYCFIGITLLSTTVLIIGYIFFKKYFQKKQKV
jgi:hypothetical protein